MHQTLPIFPWGLAETRGGIVAEASIRLELRAVISCQPAGVLLEPTPLALAVNGVLAVVGPGWLKGGSRPGPQEP